MIRAEISLSFAMFSLGMVVDQFLHLWIKNVPVNFEGVVMELAGSTLLFMSYLIKRKTNG